MHGSRRRRRAMPAGALASRRLLTSALATATGIVISACVGQGAGPNATPTASPPGSLHIQLIGAGGPYAGQPPNLVAARSEPELDALLRVPFVFFHQPDPWDSEAAVAGRVYLAIGVPFCQHLTSVRARLSSPALVTVDASVSGQCAPGAGAAARPPMYLAAILSSDLPPAVVTFRLSSGAGKARVDLRPGAALLDSSSIAVAARNAVKAALLNVGADGSSRAIAELDLLQFPTSPPLCNTSLAATGRGAGFIVVVNEGPTFPAHEEMFVWLDNSLNDCGKTSAGG